MSQMARALGVTEAACYAYCKRLKLETFGHAGKRALFEHRLARYRKRVTVRDISNETGCEPGTIRYQLQMAFERKFPWMPKPADIHELKIANHLARKPQSAVTIARKTGIDLQKIDEYIAKVKRQPEFLKHWKDQ
jgi:hypothetical protein